MPVVTIVGQYQVRSGRTFQLFENGFDLGDLGGKEAVPKLLQNDPPPSRPVEKKCRAAARFPVPLRRSGKYDPVHVDDPACAKQGQDETAAANFDVIGMRPKAEHLEGRL